MPSPRRRGVQGPGESWPGPRPLGRLKKTRARSRSAVGSAPRGRPRREGGCHARGCRRRLLAFPRALGLRHARTWGRGSVRGSTRRSMAARAARGVNLNARELTTQDADTRNFLGPGAAGRSIAVSASSLRPARRRYRRRPVAMSDSPASKAPRGGVRAPPRGSPPGGRLVLRRWGRGRIRPDPPLERQVRSPVGARAATQLMRTRAA